LPGRTPHEAIQSFLEPFKAILGCVTDEGFVARGGWLLGVQQHARFQDGFAILTRRNGQALKLELRHRFVVRPADGARGPWTISTTEYIYEVADERDDPIAAWHWHPGSGLPGDAVQWPHLHAYGTRDTLTLHRLHLPTGRVSLEAVFRFAIVDLDVVPRRADWSALLDRHEDRFRRTRSWA
jgi:hypothetical protein